jgi:hypothetical protein
MLTGGTFTTISGYLLGVTFLVFAVANGNGLVGNQLENFRSGVALDVASFILFLIATACCVSYAWVINALELRKRTPGPIISWFLVIIKSFIGVPAFFLGLVTLTVSVIGFVQAVLGTTADDGDNLAIVSVSFLAVAGAGVLVILAVASLFRLIVELNVFSRED